MGLPIRSNNNLNVLSVASRTDIIARANGELVTYLLIMSI